ncbi:YjcZ family sporulation protein [Bacillus sp. LBG-1-113]|uniref:YjcZ family sporulation protein n=1 Tax=Bacillus sp. LBG-1-113 TaxID=2886094 RepID=UPI001E32996F|nr:YjcZ family sporulation protein [Bacillus sp. LBG-1-113]MCC2931306.1 YjcZ family sporulation protein [Bacillus sp. LBG-1-113]
MGRSGYSNGGGYGFGSFALIVVLFILLIIVGTRLLSLQYSAVRQYHCPAAFF